MSANNGVYILRTLSPVDGHEYRVVYFTTERDLIAIEDIYWDNSGDDAKMIRYFGDSPVFTDPDSAYRYARDLLEKQEYTEHGICSTSVNRFFPKALDQVPTQLRDALSKIKEFVKNIFPRHKIGIKDGAIVIADIYSLRPTQVKSWELNLEYTINGNNISPPDEYSSLDGALLKITEIEALSILCAINACVETVSHK